MIRGVGAANAQRGMAGRGPHRRPGARLEEAGAVGCLGGIRARHESIGRPVPAALARLCEGMFGGHNAPYGLTTTRRPEEVV